MVIYAFLFTAAAWLIEIVHGTGSIKYLNPDWRYADLILLPSWLYLFIEHEKSFLNYDEIDANPNPYKADPSQKEDEAIEEFDDSRTEMEELAEEEVQEANDALDVVNDEDWYDKIRFLTELESKIED